MAVIFPPSGGALSATSDNTYIVAEDVTLTTAGSSAILLPFGQNDVTFVIAGTVATGTSDAIRITGERGRVFIEEEGLVTADSSTTVAFEGVDGSLINRGTILNNSSYAVFFKSDRTTLHNDGTIGSYGSAGSAIASNASATNSVLYNSGTIFGVSEASAVIDFAGFGAGIRFENSGEIQGRDQAIRLSPFDTEFVNSGQVSGDIEGRLNGVDRVANTGTINGTIDLGEGDDRFANGGVVYGHAILGDGSNVYLANRNGELYGDLIGGSAVDVVKQNGLIASDVILGEDNDSYYSRKGSIDGDWFGGAGDDLYDGRGDTAVLGTINGGDGQDTLAGGDGADTLDGAGSSDMLAGFGGDDLIFGGSGEDLILGGGGDDTIEGGSGNDLIYGKAGDDDISGDNSKDTIFGGAGDDTIAGGNGGDWLKGGAGADVFDYDDIVQSDTSSGGRDSIVDFVSGVDMFDLSDIDADTTVAGNQAFTFIGRSGFNGVAGELRYNLSERSIQGDVNGDGTADFRIDLLTAAEPMAGDFVL